MFNIVNVAYVYVYSALMNPLHNTVFPFMHDVNLIPSCFLAPIMFIEIYPEMLYFKAVIAFYRMQTIT